MVAELRLNNKTKTSQSHQPSKNHLGVLLALVICKYPKSIFELTLKKHTNDTHCSRISNLQSLNLKHPIQVNYANTTNIPIELTQKTKTTQKRYLEWEGSRGRKSFCDSGEELEFGTETREFNLKEEADV